MNNNKLPEEWIERIFKRLTEIFGARFASLFLNLSYLEVEKMRWRSGLVGATADEIKHVLNMCKSGYIPDPPNVIEFFHYCKGHKPPLVKKPDLSFEKAKPEVAEKYLQLIMDKLHGRLDCEGEIALSTLNKQILSKQNDKNTHWQDR